MAEVKGDWNGTGMGGASKEIVQNHDYGTLLLPLASPPLPTEMNSKHSPGMALL